MSKELTGAFQDMLSVKLAEWAEKAGANADIPEVSSAPAVEAPKKALRANYALDSAGLS